MKIIVGLGNPGVEYAGTRHNMGVALVERLASSSDYGWRKHYDALVYKTPDVVLVKTRDVFMNESGRLLQGLPEGELYIAHDDLDLKLGEYKIQFGRGPKDHNGVESVERALGTKDFWRVRIGIDNRTTPIDGESYVLQKFTAEEKGILDNTLDAIVKAIIPDQKPG
ncbi:MAG: Peptidyl-tRNA hydrolase [Candidatus Amesbacteria bacterium GW2011_GWA2_47_11b]|uniref:Peptidyl-tRNA hydrolase n=3 Tax=Candidatus Amesiibacteriota TaxID=1752730 RepID=A0A0G1SJV9_9BACT|nr:MAG: Peptidyl-tRNA hydrolase [Microgenomates group bacterium GW2011_GWC1_46_20]KKU57156.1 MAG: Peptidyl-tRNA hydrolase [Candidatus Amesbacteria bacterium GW2011_GWA2_47_11b]KKU69712.1 MAG: Peptidyl-tRNA hydrolase [Candidatus Amesbacteria bacterium GW2011_GWA1_47_20]KKU82919.1 MAG: Peptidyl-tRNA hydrolase [Candidatus Amesbacteria bacterium GW2011_GWC2_47_8]